MVRLNYQRFILWSLRSLLVPEVIFTYEIILVGGWYIPRTVVILVCKGVMICYIARGW